MGIISLSFYNEIINTILIIGKVQPKTVKKTKSLILQIGIAFFLLSS